MTCREKLAMEHPDCIGSNHIGGAQQCPNTYAYLDPPSYCPYKNSGVANNHTCSRCWDREIPEVKKENKMIYAHIEPGFNPNYDRHWVENSYAPTSPDIHENCKVAEGIQAGLEIPHPEYVEAFKEMGEAAVKAAEAIGVTIPKILDSGNRREFETGAVRDIQEGKGRCDLLPLDIVGDCLNDELLNHISSFIRSGDTRDLYSVLDMFAFHWDDGLCKLSTYDMCMQRKSTMFLEVAKHYEEGCNKYGARNWEKGIPVRCYIDSGVRHYLKFLRGDKDEPHDRAFVWNMLGAIWTCKHKPELNEYPIKLEVEE